MPNFIKNIQNTAFKHNLFKENNKIVLAVSGGPDSVCMLNVFFELQKKYSLKFIIAHVNYGLRGSDSQKDEELVQKLAKKNNLEIFIKKVSLKNKKVSEESLRKIRYDFFEQIRKENKFDLIAVAHNRDDQVETYLMRIIRGSGLKGLLAMKFKNNSIIRPLLETPKEEILKYLRNNKIKFRIDKTNLENKYLRNKIRNKLIPILEKDFNPNLRETIFSSLESISDDYDYISKVSKKKSKELRSLDVKKLKKLDSAILKRVILEKIEEKKGNIQNIESSNIKEILKVINSTKNKTQVVKFKNLKITRRGDKLEISKL